MAACALGVGLVRIFRLGELIVPVFAVAIVLNLGAYMISTHAQDLLGAREMAEVLPLGAVLAGRVLGDRIAAWTRAARDWFVPVLAVLAAGYLAALGFGAAQAVRPGPERAPGQPGWRRTGSPTGWPPTGRPTARTWTATARLVLSAVVQDVRDRLVPYLWETDDANYDPARHYANFVVADGPSALPGMQLSAELTFGRPAADLPRRRLHHPGLGQEPAGRAGRPGCADRASPSGDSAHMYRVRRRATTASAGSTQATIMPR